LVSQHRAGRSARNPSASVYDNRLYRALDRLLPHKPALEQHLHRRLGELFALEYDLLLYDVTSTYFEGLAKGNPARPARLRPRPSRRLQLVCIALVVTRQRMPLGYELFNGNRNDVTTVEEVVERMEARFGLAQRIWVMDRGMTSAENLAWLEQTGAFKGRRQQTGRNSPRCRRSSSLLNGWSSASPIFLFKLLWIPFGNGLHQARAIQPYTHRPA